MPQLSSLQQTHEQPWLRGGQAESCQGLWGGSLLGGHRYLSSPHHPAGSKDPWHKCH